MAVQMSIELVKQARDFSLMIQNQMVRFFIASAKVRYIETLSGFRADSLVAAAQQFEWGKTNFGLVFFAATACPSISASGLRGQKPGRDDMVREANEPFQDGQSHGIESRGEVMLRNELQLVGHLLM